MECELCGNTNKKELEKHGAELGFSTPLTICKENKGCSD